jgi:benzoate membrane transport protein
MSKWKLSHISAGLTAVTVGYSSSVVIIIDVARKAGASDDMVVSWLLALGLGMGITCILFSWLSKLPVVTAWSTPGAAFLLTSIGDYALSEAIGAFVICACFVKLVEFHQQFHLRFWPVFFYLYALLSLLMLTKRHI